MIYPQTLLHTEARKIEDGDPDQLRLPGSNHPHDRDHPLLKGPNLDRARRVIDKPHHVINKRVEDGFRLRVT